jgi:uncharacterized phage protein (TIGR02218 family)
VSRTLSPGMVTALGKRTLTLAAMLRLDLADGTTLAFTDHDRTLSVDLGDGLATFYPDTGILPSDLSLSTGFEADEIEISGPVVDAATQPWHITRAAVIGGRFDGARARIFMVDWASLASGPIRLMQGFVTRGEVAGGRFKLTIRSDISRFEQEVGRIITAYCDADFGDARCGATPVTEAATVTSVTDERGFTVSFVSSFVDDFFNRGTAAFTSGALAGTRPVEVRSFSAAGVIELFMPLAELPEVGDTLTLRQGCFDPATRTSKTRAACMTFANIANFRGFPDVPGSDQALRYPNPTA